MSIASDDRKSFVMPLVLCSQALDRAAMRLAIMWRSHVQAATLRRISAETLADIGYSQDYVRCDWENFAAQHPDTIAPAAIVRLKR